MSTDIAQLAEEIHAEHHPGHFVPSLDSCPEHMRAEYEQLARDLEMSSDAPAVVTVSRHELAQLLAVATIYVDTFRADELMTLPQKMALQDVEALLEKYGRRY